MVQKNNFAAIVLGAGAGKRMNSQTSKILHKIGDKPMILRTIDMLKSIPPQKIITVVSPQNAVEVKKILAQKSDFAIQKEPLGTADAANVGLEKVPSALKNVVVVNGDDSAFYKPQTILGAFNLHQKTKAKITFVTLILENPKGLGRVIRKNGEVLAIIEEKDANESERKIKEINVGLYFFDKEWLSKNLPKLLPSPVTGEYYLTDLIKLAIADGEVVETYKLKDPRQWHGINTQEELEAANRKFKSRIHIMGIAGAGAAAVAGIAEANGFEVSGCDINPISAYSKSTKIQIKKGHDPIHLEGVDMLVISPAVIKLDPQNKEVLKAKSLGMPVLTWQEFMAKFLQSGKFVIAVSGAYGKSTTTAMISQILIDAGLDPTCEVGAKVLSWGKNFRVGNSKYFVCEADEYNNNFLNYSPDIAIVLNIAWEHPDFFKSEKDVIGAYQKFVSNIKDNGVLVIGQKVEHLSAKGIKTITASEVENIELSIIGNFRKENARVALAVAKVLGIDPNKAQESVENFSGLGRRLEYKGEINGVKFYDDYAVQPYTIQTTAGALKEKYQSKKVLLVLEPHTFSRVETFFGDFIKSLKESNVDQIFITEVFAAREKGNKKTLAQKLAKEVGEKAKFTGTIEETARVVEKCMDSFDIILGMGAGDIYKLYDLIKK